MGHLTVSMAPNFTTFTLWPLRNTAWPPLSNPHGNLAEQVVIGVFSHNGSTAQTS
jgi:hypothetical protein